MTSMAFVSRTRATLRRAEFGFLGVVVYTRVQTPRFCGAPRSAGVLVRAFFVTRLLSRLLFETSPTDLPTFAAAAVGFAAVSFFASYVPARRASSVSPLVALRSE